MGFESAIKQAKSSGKAHYDFWFDVSTKKEGKAWILEYKIDHSLPAAWTAQAFETLQVFADMAALENRLVEKGYQDAMMSKSDGDEIIQNLMDDDLEADFQ